MLVNEITLTEFSPLTLDGSFTKDLVFNKLWIIRELEKLNRPLGVVYVLGSWYGNMGILLAKSNLKFNYVVNVDIDASVVNKSQKIAELLGLAGKVEPLIKDANTCKYRELDSNGIVINASCHDMENAGWYDNIPNNTLVVLQSRNDVDHDLDQYQLNEVLYNGKLNLQDPQTKYVSYLRIGVK